jgi:hypothetical protein
MELPAVEAVDLKLPLTVVEPSYSHGSHGAIRIADADHRIVFEVVNGGRDTAEELVARLNAK